MFKDAGESYRLLISQQLVQDGTCPECRNPLYVWKTKNSDGTERCVPTCMECGYRNIKIRESKETLYRMEENRKQLMVSQFKSNSIVPDRELFKCSLQNYQEVDQETKVARNIAANFAKAVLQGNSNHLILTGKSGSGKSHLAMGVCWNVMKHSSYKRKCLYVNYRQLLEELKNAFNIPSYYSDIHGSLMREIKRADLVVIDDIGVELGGTAAKGATAYNADTLYSILDARLNMATVITTNLNTDEIQRSYGDRILSRIVSNSNGYIVKFTKTMDKRVVGI